MSNSLFQAIKLSQNKLAKSLSQNAKQPINSIIDEDNSTVLHIAANNGNVEMAEYFLHLYDRMIQADSQRYNLFKKRQWINMKDNEGFCCLHYAVFRGNFKLANMLQTHGADIYLINTQGLSVLHIAAQGDSPCLMYYYLSKGFKISMKDFKGSTALHWACYSGQQNSVSALLSWESQIDLQDFTYGMTPLHLSVMSGNGRIVKKLLLKGCDRNIRDYNGKLAIDIARQNEYSNITTMIQDKGGIQEFLNIKSPFRKTAKRTFHFIFFVVLFFSNYVLNIGFVIFQRREGIQIMGIIYLAIGLICLILFFAVSFADPGKLKPQHNPNFFNVMMRNDASKLCFDCRIIKPQRSRHCQVCDSCVSVFDHHCPWVGNCVGAKNYCYFYSFLVCLIIFMVYTVVFEVINLTYNVWSDVQATDVIRSICIVLALLISAFFSLPLSFLLFIQTKNLLTDMTTFQRYSGKNRQSKSISNISVDQSTHNLRSSLLNEDRSLEKLEREASLNSQTMSMANQKSLSKIIPKVQDRSPCSNCYNMCFGNYKNIKYQVGGF